VDLTGASTVDEALEQIDGRASAEGLEGATGA
jgi:hypothetical protein